MWTVDRNRSCSSNIAAISSHRSGSSRGGVSATPSVSSRAVSSVQSNASRCRPVWAVVVVIGILRVRVREYLRPNTTRADSVAPATWTVDVTSARRRCGSGSRWPDSLGCRSCPRRQPVPRSAQTQLADPSPAASSRVRLLGPVVRSLLSLRRHRVSDAVERGCHTRQPSLHRGAPLPHPDVHLAAVIVPGGALSVHFEAGAMSCRRTGACDPKRRHVRTQPCAGLSMSARMLKRPGPRSVVVPFVVRTGVRPGRSSL
jgi:hypothetical protein